MLEIEPLLYSYKEQDHISSQLQMVEIQMLMLHLKLNKILMAFGHIFILHIIWIRRAVLHSLNMEMRKL